MTPIELKELLATLLTDELGTYIAADSTTQAPAIACLFSNEEQGSRAVEGLEVVVSFGPASSQNTLYYGQIDPSVQHRISLIQHKTSSLPQLPTAVRKLQSRFINITGAPVRVDEESAALEEYTMLLPDSDLVAADRLVR